MSGNPTTPSVDDIPYANELQMQLTTLDNAISLLGSSGIVSFLTVDPPPPPPSVGGSGVGIPLSPVTPVQSVRVSLDPPISDPTTIGYITTQLQDQADAITTQLASMGYAPSSRTAAKKAAT
jgi:hypothetical protein